MNLVLIGYRGTGKSTVGHLLAEQLGMRYVGMDSEIVKRAGVSIPAIVAQRGWSGFRDLESELTQEFARQDGLVIDTGGGVIERAENVRELQANSMIFWLQASVNTIVLRIQDDSSRPALTDGKTFVEEVAEVLTRREPLYRTAAAHLVETDGRTPEQIAQSVSNLWIRQNPA